MTPINLEELERLRGKAVPAIVPINTLDEAVGRAMADYMMKLVHLAPSLLSELRASREAMKMVEDELWAERTPRDANQDYELGWLRANEEWRNKKLAIISDYKKAISK